MLFVHLFVCLFIIIARLTMCGFLQEMTKNDSQSPDTGGSKKSLVSSYSRSPSPLEEGETDRSVRSSRDRRTSRSPESRRTSSSHGSQRSRSPPSHSSHSSRSRRHRSRSRSPRRQRRSRSRSPRRNRGRH